MSLKSASLVAGGNINPCRFLKMDSSNHQVIQAAAATDVPIAISQEAQRTAPITGASDVVAASGESVPAYFEGDVCRLQIGSGGCSPGTLLVPDSDGKGVAAAGSGTALQCVGAIALETASENEFALVVKVLTFRRHALA